ncbi:MAG: DUF1778 domain-containing protein [Alphaproteobacteria bacterium]|nr:DUF1778 domain-containing protein [Alphaproteobacteria bacterium]
MAKKAPKRAPADRSSKAEEKDLSTLSIRVTEKDRELLAQAAELRGWTPTALIRTAALERAAHILNTSRATKFDFKVLASQIAARLFQGHRIKHQISHDEWNSLEGLAPEDCSLDVDVPPLEIDTLRKLRDAARLGGAEFLAAVVDFAESLTAQHRWDLPDPVDPTKTNL